MAGVRPNQDHESPVIGEQLFPLEMEYLPEFFRKKGEIELNYTPSNREISLEKLKEAMANDSALEDLQLNDPLLLLFLNSRKYDVDKTVLQIKKYLKFRNDKSHFFTNFNFEELSPFMTSDFISVFPWRCQDGCAVSILKLGNWDPEKHPDLACKKMFLIVLQQPFRYPMTQVNGFKCIIDLNININALRLCTYQNIHEIYSFAERVFPGRFKEYHLVNMGIIGRIVWNIAKIILPEKIKKKVHIHESVDKILDFFPRALLPLEYGGDLREYDMTEWLRKVTSPEELAFFNVTSR